jgi:hypothetical protein
MRGYTTATPPASNGLRTRDLDRLARVVAELLRPSGQVYVVEFHPVLTALGLVPDGDVDGRLLPPVAGRG